MNARRFSFLLLVLLTVTSLHATEAQHIRASHAWIRVLPGDLPAAAYVTLANESDHPIALRSARSPAYAEVMLHRSAGEGGMNRMTMVDELPVPAHGVARLAPAGYHLMLTKAVSPVKPGDTVRLTLRFSDDSVLDSDFIARPASALDDGTR